MPILSFDWSRVFDDKRLKRGKNFVGFKHKIYKKVVLSPQDSRSQSRGIFKSFAVPFAVPDIVRFFQYHVSVVGSIIIDLKERKDRLMDLTHRPGPAMGRCINL